jgi:soluble lytic murein transglycosylase
MARAAAVVRRPRPRAFAAACTTLAALVVLAPAGGATRQEGGEILQPTRHDPLPAQPTGYWLTPAPAAALTQPLRDFARAVAVIDDGGDVTSVAPLLDSSALDTTPVVDHVRYYRGLVAMKQNRLDTAAGFFTSVATATTRSAVVEQALWRLADVHELRGQYGLARDVLTRLLASGPAEPDRVSHRLGVAAERAGDVAASIAAHRVTHFDYPLSPDAEASGEVLERLHAAAGPFPDRLEKMRARAAALYAARRWSAARAAYLDLAGEAAGEVKDGAHVRIAGADVQAKQYRAAIDRLRPLMGEGPHQAEARFQYGLALRGQGDVNGYVQSVRALVEAQPQSPYTEDALNALATWYVLRDDDAAAAEVFGQLVQRFPAGRHAERAAWKAGWWAYRHGEDAAAVTYFELGARQFPRSDYRPAWLYWSGKAKMRLGDAAGARSRLQLAVTDYKNSYYGRLAQTALGADVVVPPSIAEGPAARGPMPPTERQIGTLMSLGLHDLALAEIAFARRVYGDSPQLVATAALAQHRAGRLRLGINAMKRAYPQYLAAGGESLPPEVLRVIFPVDYFQQLQGSASRRGIDPFLLVALAAQESTFDAGISSSAGAIGLLQIMPATGRAVARQLGIKPFTTRRLTDPEINMAIGTEYFGDLLAQFGHAAYALAGYNAGGHRVVRWKSERPNLPLDEWIDDIPFPETQNYVKRILGTAEDYRRLYGGGLLSPVSSGAASRPATLPPVAAPARGAADGPAVTSPARTPAKKRPPTKRRPGTRPRRPGQ